MTRRFRPALLAIVILALLPASARGQGEAPYLTLSQALEEVAAHSQPAVDSRLAEQSAREGTNQLKALYYPTVTLSGGHFNRDSPVVAVFGALEAPTIERSYWTAELAARELLWDGGRRSSALEASRKGEAAVARQGAAGVTVTQVEAMGTYLAVLSRKAEHRVVEQRAKALESHLDVVHNLFEQGIVARNDLLETEVRLRLIQDQLSRVQDQMIVTGQSLNRLMGRSPSESLELPPSLPPPPPLAEDLELYKRSATESNPQVLALQARLEAEEKQVLVTRQEYYPSFFAEAAHTYQENRYLAYPNANSLFLGVSWDLFDGGIRGAAVRQADVELQRTGRELLEAQRSVEVQVEQAYRDFRQAVKEAKTAQTNVAAAEENLRIVEDQYKAGLAKTTDVLDAESVLAESRFALVSQHYSAYLKQGTLLAVVGRDLAAFYKDLPPAGQGQ